MDTRLAIASCIVAVLALNGKVVFTQNALMSLEQASRIGMSEVILSYFSVLIDQRYNSCVPATVVSYPLSTATNSTATFARTLWQAPVGGQDVYANEHHAPNSFFDVFTEVELPAVAMVDVSIHSLGGNLHTRVRGDNAGTNWRNQTYMGGGFDRTFAVMSLSIGGLFANPAGGDIDYWDEHIIKDFRLKNRRLPNGQIVKDIYDDGLEVITRRGIPRQKWSQRSWFSGDQNERRWKFVKTRIVPKTPKCYISFEARQAAVASPDDVFVLTVGGSKPPTPAP
jgi:hypothetical protein